MGLRLAFVMLVIGIEFFFLVFSKFLDNEIQRAEFTVQVIASMLAIFLPLSALRDFRLPLWPVFIIPCVYGICRGLESMQEAKIESESEGRRVANLKKTIKYRPDLAEPLIAMGDIMFKKGDYAEAIFYYQKAYKIKETPEISHKIKVSKKEQALAAGYLWVCKECGVENSLDKKRCKACNCSRDAIASVKEDIERNKKEIKTWLIKGLSVIAGSGLLLFMLVRLAGNTFIMVLSFLIFAFLTYAVLKKLFTF